VPMLNDILRAFTVVPVKEGVEYKGSLNPMTFLNEGRYYERPWVIIKVGNLLLFLKWCFLLFNVSQNSKISCCYYFFVIN